MYRRQDPHHESRDDQRERSPRRDNNSDRHQEGRYDSRRAGPQASYQQRQQQRGHSDRPDSTPSGASHLPEERLPTIPDEVPIPQYGKRFETELQTSCRGATGRACEVLVNRFVIKSLPVVKIYQYDIRMRVPPTSQRRGSSEITPAQISKTYKAIGDSGIFGGSFVTDGISNAWSPKLLLKEGVAEDQQMIDLPGHTEQRPNQVQISLRLSGKIDLQGLVHYILSGQVSLNTGNPSIDDAFRWLNATFKDGPAKKFISFPKSTAFFHRTNGLVQQLQSTRGTLEAIRGIYQSLSLGFGVISLCIDTKCAAFFVPDKPMMDFLKAGGEELVTGMYFTVKHLGPLKALIKKRVQKISDKNAETTIFEWTDPGTNIPVQISVAAYYLRKYNIRLRYPTQPLLVCRDGAFPPELCFSAPNERYKEALQGKDTADFIKWATSPAFVRNKQIMDNVARLETWNDPKVTKMGLSVEPRMLTVPALILPPPIPCYSNGPIQMGDAERGSWNLRDKIFIKPSKWHSWAIICLRGARGAPPENALLNLAQSLLRSCQGHGLEGPRTQPPVLYGSLQRPVSEVIEEAIRAVLQTYKTDPELFLFVLQADMPTSIYKAIKQECEILKGVASQVVLADRCMGHKGASPQYLSNVAMKVNVKLGGSNMHVMEPLFDGKEVFMILGADVTHPSPAELRSKTPPPSFAALVASMDRYCSKYSAVCVAQASTQELIARETLRDMYKEQMKRWKALGGPKPTSIIYMRDGVSDSMVKQVKATELTALREAMNDLDMQSTTLTFVNCLKRHHTRLFPKNRQLSDKLGNVLPGTVVENSRENDIYMVSQAALQGTCRPTHYMCIHDERNLTITEFERLMLQGCFNYQRATRSVALHSAVYYADQACERAKLHLVENQSGGITLRDVHPRLYNTMYWQ